MTTAPEPLARHLATFNLFREADNSLHVTIADARGVMTELGDSGAPLHLCAMNALRAALTAPDRVGWQPIASAPRDGTRVLLWLDTRNPRDTPYVEQVCDGEHVVQADIGFWDEDPGCWRAPIIGEPTHWRPLPAPPRAALGDG